jgi:hypothetical protein
MTAALGVGRSMSPELEAPQEYRYCQNHKRLQAAHQDHNAQHSTTLLPKLTGHCIARATLPSGTTGRRRTRKSGTRRMTTADATKYFTPTLLRRPPKTLTSSSAALMFICNRRRHGGVITILSTSGASIQPIAQARILHNFSLG